MNFQLVEKVGSELSVK